MDFAAIHLLSALYYDTRNIVAHKSTNELMLSSELTDQTYNYINFVYNVTYKQTYQKKSECISVNDIRENCGHN